MTIYWFCGDTNQGMVLTSATQCNAYRLFRGDTNQGRRDTNQGVGFVETRTKAWSCVGGKPDGVLVLMTMIYSPFGRLKPAGMDDASDDDIVKNFEGIKSQYEILYF